jgi:hypothetical protein
LYCHDHFEVEIEYYYKNGELQCYSYKGVFYDAQFPEHLAKNECDLGEDSYVNSIERPDVDESEQLDWSEPETVRSTALQDVGERLNSVDVVEGGCELLESECNELYHKLIDEHGYEKVERCAIEGLMRFIKSFTNPEEMRQKINTALLIPDSKMYNQNWAGTDWDWFTGEMKKNERDGWSFTDEERESIRISRETIRNMVEAGRMERLMFEDSEEGQLIEHNSDDDSDDK